MSQPGPDGVLVLRNSGVSPHETTQNPFRLASATDEADVHAVALPDGRVVMVWAVGGDIRLQTFEPSGKPEGTPTTVAGTAAAESQPNIALLANGDVVVTWSELSAGLYDVEAQTFRISGPVGTPTIVAGSVVTVADDTNADNGIPVNNIAPDADVAATSGGNFAVAYVAAGIDGTDVRYRVNGGITNIIQNGGSDETPSIAAAPDGTVLLAWENTSSGNSSVGLWDGSDLIPIPGETGSGFERAPDVVRLPDGNYLVVWSSNNGTGSTNGVRAQIFDADGNSVVPATLLTTAPSSEWFPSATVLEDGSGFVLTWIGNANPNPNSNVSIGDDVFTQTFNVADLTPRSDVVRVTLTGNAPTINEVDATPTALDDGRVLVTWIEPDPLAGTGTGPATNPDLRYQFFDPGTGADFTAGGDIIALPPSFTLFDTTEVLQQVSISGLPFDFAFTVGEFDFFGDFALGGGDPGGGGLGGDEGGTEAPWVIDRRQGAASAAFLDQLAAGATQLQLIPPANFTGPLSLSITASSFEGTDQSQVNLLTTSTSAPLTFNMTIVPNEPPVINNLGGDTVSFTEDGDPVLLDAGTVATVTDANNTDFNNGSLTVSVTGNGIPAEDVLGISIAGTVSLSDSTNVGSEVSVGGVVIGTISGSGVNGNLVVDFDADATPVRVSTLIQSLTYANSNTFNPASAARTLSVTVNDGLGESDTETVQVFITTANDAPILLTSAGTASFTEARNATPPTPVAIDPALTLTDDDSIAAAATVSITGNFQGGDILAFVNNSAALYGNIQVDSYAGGVLALSSPGATASVAQWQNALRAVTFSIDGSIDTPDTGNRTVTFQIGGGDPSGPASRDVTVTAGNDDPALAGAPGSVVVAEDVSTEIDLSSITFGDPDSGGDDITLTLTAGTGTLQAQDAGGVTVTGSTTSTLTLTGTAAEIDAYLNGLSPIEYTTATDENGINVDIIALSANDLGNTGANGGATVALGSILVDATEVNDDPTATDDVVTPAVDEDSGTRIIAIADLIANDSEGPANEAVQNLDIVDVFNEIGGTAQINGANIEFVLDPNFNGTASFDYTVEDNGTTNGTPDPRTDVGHVTFDVNPINDQPSFVISDASIVVDEDAGAQNFAAWATSISAGAANESGQTLTFQVVVTGTTDNLAFTFGPTVDPITGNLTFTTAPDTYGAAQIDVTLVDNGSGVAPNDNTSVTQSFVIIANPVNDAPQPAGFDNTPTFTEDGTAVVLDDNASIVDTEAAAANNYDGAVLTLQRQGGANATDVFGPSGTLSFAGTNVLIGAIVIGTLTTNAGGVLAITFNGNATSASVDDVVQQLTYRTTSQNPPGSVTIDFTLNDGEPGVGGASVGTGSITVGVNAVNDAPVLNAARTPVLQAEREDPGAPGVGAGTLVSQLVSLSGGVNNVTDADGGVTGIALTATAGPGTWLYSTNGGTSWNPVGAVTNTSALLLAANASTRLYFLPADPDFDGTINNAITFRAWDQSTGTNGQSGVNTSVNGTTTAFSTATDTANITITDVPGYALVGTGDINGDGRDDLLWREEHGELLVWYNGAQNQAVSLGNLDPVWSIVGLGDFNGNGSDEIVRRHANGELVVDGVSRGILDNVWVIETIGDFNGDGRDEFVYRRSDNGELRVDGVNRGRLDHVWTIVGDGDINGDGRDELVYRRTDNGELSVDGVSRGLLDHVWTIQAIDDFNGDGRDEFVLRRSDNGETTIDGRSIGRYAPVWTIESSGDFDGNGNAELVLRHINGTVKINGHNVGVLDVI